MIVEYYAGKEVADLQQALEKFSTLASVQSIALLGCDENAWQKSELDPILQAQSLPILGGIFPQVVFNNQNHTQGFVLVGLKRPLTPVLIEGLSDNDCDYEALLDELIDEETDFSSMIVFVDGLSSRISGFVDSLFALFGADVNYIGGGAGSLSFESKPCVLSNQGVFANAAVLGLLPESIPIQVGHGWKSFDTGHVVTRVEKNVVQEIDYKNALEVYQEVIRDHLKNGEPLTAENFFANAQSFPLGIKRADGDYIVRDPIALNDEGALICVGELSSGDHIDILTAQPEDLIASAGLLAQQAASELPANDALQGVMLVDCISRALFLQQDFQQELTAAQQPFGENSTMFGVLVLGEIANSGTGYLEFYNKTSVIACF